MTMKKELRDMGDILARVLGPAAVAANERALAWAEVLRNKVDRPRLAEPVIYHGDYASVWAVPPGREGDYPGHTYHCGLCGGSDHHRLWGPEDAKTAIEDHLDTRHPDVRFRVAELVYSEGGIEAPDVYEYTGSRT